MNHCEIKGVKWQLLFTVLSGHNKTGLTIRRNSQLGISVRRLLFFFVGALFYSDNKKSIFAIITDECLSEVETRNE